MRQDSGQTSWWRNAVVYQVYPRSFADSNGDGIGDIGGISSKLEYLSDLGVDAIWINPWYDSPLLDGGYDVADYRQINSEYGEMADAENLIARCHELGMLVIADVVPNHTSWDHRWFVEALESKPGSPARERYHFLDGVDGGPPNNWTSVFGGTAWTQVPDGQWYLRIFDTSQPDLNWNHPEVREEFLDVLRFWLDRGIDGFRVDVAQGLIKDMTYRDANEETGQILSGSKDLNHPFWDQDEVHEPIRTWRALLDTYEDRMMVAEAWVPTAERLALYLRPDEYHQAFNFDFLEADWNPQSWKGLVDDAVISQAAVNSTPTWVLSNHDVVRHATRYGLPEGTNWRQWLLDGPHSVLDAELGARRARAATMFILSLPGSTYLYQGEELGLPEVWDLPVEVLDDPVWERSGHTAKGRDGCRVPIPWESTGPSFGFSAGEGWLPSPGYFSALSAEAQSGDPTSSLELYRTLLRLRSEHFLGDEKMEWDQRCPDGVLGVIRPTGSTCWLNMGDDDVVLPEGVSVLVRSNQTKGTQNLSPSTAVWFT